MTTPIENRPEPLHPRRDLLRRTRSERLTTWHCQTSNSVDLIYPKLDIPTTTNGLSRAASFLTHQTSRRLQDVPQVHPSPSSRRQQRVEARMYVHDEDRNRSRSRSRSRRPQLNPTLSMRSSRRRTSTLTSGSLSADTNSRPSSLYGQLGSSTASRPASFHGLSCVDTVVKPTLLDCPPALGSSKSSTESGAAQLQDAPRETFNRYSAPPAPLRRRITNPELEVWKQQNRMSAPVYLAPVPGSPADTDVKFIYPRFSAERKKKQSRRRACIVDGLFVGDNSKPVSSTSSKPRPARLTLRSPKLLDMSPKSPPSPCFSNNIPATRSRDDISQVTTSASWFLWQVHVDGKAPMTFPNRDLRRRWSSIRPSFAGAWDTKSPTTPAIFGFPEGMSRPSGLRECESA